MRGGACGTFGREEKCLQDIRGKLEEIDHLRKPRCRWWKNLKIRLE
jgi:hypothetical protein